MVALKMKVLGFMLIMLSISVFTKGDENESPRPPTLVKIVKGKKMCAKDWECTKLSRFCCNLTISDYFETYQFENLFSKRNSPIAHAVGFWDYKSFITASADYQPLGFGTTGGKKMQMKEIAAFLGHVGSKTSYPPEMLLHPCWILEKKIHNFGASDMHLEAFLKDPSSIAFCCSGNGGYGVATGGPLAWGLCYNKEMSPSQDYCDDYFKLTYPCSPGVQYYGRGALPIYWNYNYGTIGEALKVDLLNHPEFIEQNATLAFQAAIWQWMNPVKKGQPSAHDAFVGNWKPTKNDTLSKRVPGFGTTMNILYGDNVCNQGDVDSMNNIISHYLYYLDLMGVGREEAGPNEILTCAEQKPFNPSSAPTASS